MGTGSIRAILLTGLLGAPLTASGQPAAAASAAAASYTWRNVEIVGGGFVPGIVYSPSVPGLVYARTDIGGAYRRDPGASRWTPLLDWVGWDDWGLTGIVSLALDPNSGDRVYLAAGTYTNDWDPHNGAILRSADRGATWARTDLPFKLGGNMPGRGMGERLAVDPHDGRVLYLGAPSGNGLWRSTDSGASWARVTSFPNPGNYVQDPADPNGYLSDNQGVVWVTFDRRTGSTGSWTRISPVPSSDVDNNFFGYAGLTVDRQNPSTIMVTAYSSWWPDTMIWRSRDSGATWSRIWDWTRYPARSFRYTHNISAAPWLDLGDPGARDAEVTPKLGWMTEALEINPFNSNEMLYGTGATTFGSDNLTAWDSGGQIAISVKAQGLEETAVNDLVSPPAGAPLLSALGDIAGFRHDNLSTVPATTFRNPDWPTSTSLMTKQPAGVTGGGTVAVAAAGGRVLWSPAGAGVHYTSNNGKAWTASTGIPAGARVAADRANASTFYGFAGGVFYTSTNGGASFTASAATGLPAIGKAQLKAVFGRAGDVWLAGGDPTGAYGLWHSTNSGATFTRLSNVEQADSVGFGRAARAGVPGGLHQREDRRGTRHPPLGRCRRHLGTDQ